MRQLKRTVRPSPTSRSPTRTLACFKPCAKKYDIDYTLRKDTHHPPAALYRDFQDQAGATIWNRRSRSSRPRS
ncbi:MAG: hypothetical protein ACLR8Q_01600 [[Ruminococcus] lactaris]|uniref:hypothetical protein n=1 Tax=[Ruminococcus] lactaris TaxID=46228 RepID=UPI0039A3DD4B